MQRYAPDGETPTDMRGDSLLKRHSPPLLVLGMGLAITFYLFAFTTELEREKMLVDFGHEARSHTAAFREIVADNILALEALESFYFSSYDVERGEFHRFTKHLLTHYKGLRALEWILRVPASERASYEAAARKDGLRGFAITERDENGALVPASARGEYYPVYYLEPHAGNEAAMGFDLGSDPSLLEALLAARDTGRMAATPMLDLVPGEDKHSGVLIIQPIYRKNAPLDSPDDRRKAHQGFVLGVFTIGDMLEESISLFVAKGIDIHFFDDSSPPGKRHLYTHISGAPPEGPRPSAPVEAQLAGGLHSLNTIEVADRKWVVYCVPTEAFMKAGRTWHTWGILAGGLLFSALFSGFTGLAAGHVRESRQHASEILRSKDELEHEVMERQRAEEQLRHSQKMEALGTLSAGIAHEYYNILTAIMGSSEMLRDEMPEDSQLHKYADIIQQSVERAQKVTQSLLSYSRKQVANFDYLDINEVVDHMRALLEHLKVENIRFSFVPSVERLVLMADRSQIEQVLMNLSTNAIDAMPEGGTLSISTKPVEFREDFVEKQARIRAGKYVLLTVSDTGIGISGKSLQGIFEPFFTTKDVGKGTGLGLSMAYGIIKKHKGYINVFSEPGKGATFKVYLPLAEPGGDAA